MRIHFASAGSSGTSASTASSVTRMSSGSPDSATQRNGPLPSQNSGRMYAGTKPGYAADAPATPAISACARRLLP